LLKLSFEIYVISNPVNNEEKPGRKLSSVFTSYKQGESFPLIIIKQEVINMGYRRTIPFFLVPAMLFLLPGLMQAQDVSLSANLSAEEIRPTDQLEVIITLNDPADVYFLSAEVIYDPQVLRFISAEHTGLMEGGLSVAEPLSQNRIGAAVVRTSPLTEPASGDLVRLVFEVRRYSDSGESLIRFENMELVSSEDEPIPFEPVADAVFEVEEAITDVRLAIPANNDVTEGDSFVVLADVFASGVTSSSGNDERLQLWVGLSEENTNPSGWDESLWRLMEFAGTEEAYYRYEEEVAFQTPLGTYYIAVRAELDENGELFYGGLGDFWDPLTNPSATLTISEQPPFRYTIAAWDFDDETLTVSQSLPQNDEAVIEVIGANPPGFAAGATGRAASATGWGDFDPEIEKYWLVSISTEGIESIQLSSKQSGTNTGPRDFQLQVSLDGVDWEDVVGGSITVTTNFTNGSLEQLALPSFVENHSEVFIRWLQVSDIRVDGDEGVTTGSNRIDDIIITGINPNAERVEVWPGDTNDDGVVDETDVLILSAYWNSRGPLAVYQTRSWEARPVESWIPIQATFADANGDGIVNQSDLLPIGLNFGQSRIVGRQVWPDDAIASVPLSRLSAGEEAVLYIFADEEIPLTGLSMRINISGVDEHDWNIRSVRGMEWSENWKEEGRLLEFNTRIDEGISSAIAHRGVARAGSKTKELAEVTIVAVSDWEADATAELVRVSVVNGREIMTLANAVITTDSEGDITGPPVELPQLTELMQNYPNPFNPTTTIRYTLSQPSDVRVDVYNALGARVATLIQEAQAAGEYAVPFDATNLSSGVYFYRLQTQNYSRTRSMVLIK
jgi:hypothetical protein